MCFKFSENREQFKGKNFIVIGDSVSAEETYNNRGKTYLSLICGVLGSNFLKNYAIGGTTATYMYKGSNIEKEYADCAIAVDGCRVAKKAFDNDELSHVDYAFVEYGHNDQYFQPDISGDKDNSFSPDSFDSCHTFKGSLKYIISLLRLANPNVKVILMACTYSEYAARSKQWEHIIPYEKYVQAIRDVAKEMNCKLIDPWEYMKPYFDGKTDKHYYHDDVHLSPFGHQVLADFILSKN